MKENKIAYWILALVAVVAVAGVWLMNSNAKMAAEQAAIDAQSQQMPVDEPLLGSSTDARLDGNACNELKIRCRDESPQYCAIYDQKCL